MRFVSVLVGLITAAWFSTASQTEAAIIINEVFFNPGGQDANHDGTADSSDDEFIEFVNTDPLSLSLGGWSVRDATRVRHLFEPTASIDPFEFLVLFGGGNPLGFLNASVASTGSLGLNNTGGDVVSLLDPSGLVVTSFSYSQALSGASLTRFPDATGAFVDHRTISPLAFSPGSTAIGDPSLDRPELSLEPEPDPSVPEPPPWMLLGVGLVAFGWRQRQVSW